MLSIIIPHRNRLFLLKPLVEKLQDFEIIVADDCSHPEVQEKVARLPITGMYAGKGVAGWTGEIIKGAFEISTGDTILFLEDDWVTDDWSQLKIYAELLNQGYDAVNLCPIAKIDTPHISNRPYLVKRDTFKQLGIFDCGNISHIDRTVFANSPKSIFMVNAFKHLGDSVSTKTEHSNNLDRSLAIEVNGPRCKVVEGIEHTTSYILHLGQAKPLERKKRKILKSLIKGGTSIVKTTVLRKDRASPELQAERLAICAACDEYTVYHQVHICGQLMKSNKKTCGCILESKVKDTKQECPQKKW